MGTIVGLRVDDGVTIAADRRATSGGTVRSDTVRKLFDYDAAGAVATGDPGEIEEFGRSLDAEIRRLQTRQGTTIRIPALERLASDLAAETGVEAVVAARNPDLVAELRAIDTTGGVVSDPVVARGSGAQVALGHLDGADLDIALDEAESLVEGAFEAVAERDTATGDEIDVWRLTDG